MEERNNELLKTFSGLLEQSEGRIDRTNKMISDCMSIMSKITDEYTVQIERLQASRDSLMEENRKLVDENSAILRQMDESSKRYDRLLEKVFSAFSRDARSENNITVK